MANYYSSTIQKGSKGDEVKKWQTYLNSQGYNLSVDGDFGDNTYNATVDYQKKNGLGVDGIVGKNTWGRAGFTNLSDPTAAPPLESAPPLTDYITTTWDETEKGQETNKARNDALDALQGQDPFTFSQQDWLDKIFEDIKGYGDFSYDLNGDALYQQYKNKYIQQGKLAMMDTMGQAAAMNGGYGSSYAQSVGQQAYQGSLDKLNDIVPDLYQMALDKYNTGKQDLYNQYGMLSSEYDREYGQWTDEYGRLMDAYNIANSAYYDGANLHNTEVSNQNSVIGRENDETLSIWGENNANLWKQAEWDEAARRYEEAKASGGSGESGSNQGLQHVGSMSPQEIVETMQSYSVDGDNKGLAAFLDDCVASGRMTEEQADEYYKKYRTGDGDDVVDTTVQPIVPNVTGNRVTGGGGGRFFEIAHK